MLTDLTIKCPECKTNYSPSTWECNEPEDKRRYYVFCPKCDLYLSRTKNDENVTAKPKPK